MKCDVTLRDPNLPSAVKSFVEEKVARLDRLGKGVRGVHAFLSSESEWKRVELVALLERGSSLVVEARHGDPFAAVDLAVDRLERRLAKEKEKRVGRKRRRPGASGRG